MNRITEIIGTCDNENLYSVAGAKIKIREELKKSGEVKNPEALDYFAQLQLETMLVSKLGQLEDIEEELGIDLITLFKALKNGVWSTLSYSDINRMIYEKRQNQKYFYYDNVAITKDHLLINSSGDDTWGSYVIKYADYGETWALTKEELLH